MVTIVNASAFKSGPPFCGLDRAGPGTEWQRWKNGIGPHLQEGRTVPTRLLVLGATAVVRYVRNKPDLAGWVNALLARRPARVVTVAVANKLACIVWAIMQRGGTFRERPFGIA